MIPISNHNPMSRIQIKRQAIMQSVNLDMDNQNSSMDSPNTANSHSMASHNMASSMDNNSMASPSTANSHSMASLNTVFQAHRQKQRTGRQRCSCAFSWDGSEFTVSIQGTL
jgi:hypothetical protein